MDEDEVPGMFVVDEYDAFIDRLLSGMTSDEVDAYVPTREDVAWHDHFVRLEMLNVSERDFQTERLKETVSDPNGERARMFDEEAAWMERHRK